MYETSFPKKNPLKWYIIAIIPIVLLLELYLLETVCGLSENHPGHQI